MYITIDLTLEQGTFEISTYVVQTISTNLIICQYVCKYFSTEMKVLSYSQIVLPGRNTKFRILRKLRKQQCGMWVHISHSLAVKTTLVVQRQTAQICKIKQWLGSERKQDRDFAILLCQSLSAIAYVCFRHVILFEKMLQQIVGQLLMRRFGCINDEDVKLCIEFSSY